MSGTASPRPLLAVKAPAGQVRLRFEDLGPIASSYSIYEGSLGAWFSHEAAACNVTPSRAAGTAEWSLMARPGKRYFQVAASSACAEGPLAPGIAPASPRCGP